MEVGSHAEEQRALQLTFELRSAQRNSGSASELYRSISSRAGRSPISPKDVLPVPSRPEPTKRSRRQKKVGNIIIFTQERADD
jgi:hypothetical protein